MKSFKDELDFLNIVKKRANSLSEKVLIVSKPEKAKDFLISSKNKARETKKNYKKLIKQVKLFKHLTHEVSNLFDNYYIIDSVISDILNIKLNKDFKKLVQIEKTTDVFIPRIYFILFDLLKSTKFKIDQDILRCFLETYQNQAHLSIRELNYIPLFLKLILIENIDKVICESVVSLNEYKDADFWFDQIVKKVKRDSNPDFSKITSDLTLKYGVIPINLSFHLLQKLSQYGPDTRPIVKWLKLNLLKRGINIADLAEIENSRQDSVSKQIFNIIESLRWINQIRWDDFVNSVNIVDLFLAKDPSLFYTKLDQASQFIYRNEIVKISDRSGILESEVVKMALSLCRQSTKTTEQDSENHIGYYLLGAGREYLEKKLNYKKTKLENIQSFILKNSTIVYLGIILAINIVLSVALFYFLPESISFLGSIFALAILFILSLDITINLINILISSLIPVRVLPKLDLTSGLEKEQATFVVMPSMFRDIKSASDLIKKLEVNFLGNNNNNLYYGLLMDFKDSKTEKNSTDELLVNEVQKGIDYLNIKYPSVVKRFYLFHRQRLFNSQEGVFMGWERKRGKLREFNLLLRNKRETSYIQKLPIDLPLIKYVLTIDEDTRLPTDSASKLVGCIDHPLNRPVLDYTKHLVVKGYGIIQPRMTSKFTSGHATSFAKAFSNAVGLDSYSGPVADVYQDLFNNSIFYGKGIYDVDTMEEVIGDYIPENQVLSHDLLEGIYTKVGFATDILLFEGFPESYKEYILRMHRWIRGDWQIISWLKFNKNKNNHFSLSDKWKIFDNLRRSSLPIFAILFLSLIYFISPNSYSTALLLSILILSSSFIISYLFDLFRWSYDMSILMKIKSVLNGLDALLLQIFYRFVFLLDQAIVSLRAISVSIFRMIFSHKNLLLWQNSHEVSKNLKGTLREFVYTMFVTEFISLFLLILLLIYHSNFIAYLTIIFWFISPIVAYKISQKPKIFSYKKKDLKLLRKIACRSARFFLELSVKDGNKLIPDHFQEKPIVNSPASTSPTNIGMHLLSNLSAFDLGYLGFSAFCEKTNQVLEVLDSLERYNGHLFNWYDVQTRQALSPKYVSSVDSANFLLNLLVLKQGILDIIKNPILNKNTLNGIEDIFAVFTDDTYQLLKYKGISKTDKKLAKNISKEIKLVNYILSDLNINSIESIYKVFNKLFDINENIKKIVSHFDPSKNKEIVSSIYSSSEHLNNLLKQKLDDLDIFMPYHDLRRNRPVVRDEVKNKDLASKLDLIYRKIDQVPTLKDLFIFKSDIESISFREVLKNSNILNTDKENFEKWYNSLLEKIDLSLKIAIKYQDRYINAISLADKFFNEADFTFLYNKERGLFHIGYSATFDKKDNSYYDFIASEANSISFVSILKKQIPLKHWFYLGRKLVRLDMENVLLSSWGGSLFEYLTSLIFFKVHKESILGKTAKLAINAHIKYGQKHSVPWGMGESAFSNMDLNNNYQYQIFGHPDLGFRRDLKDFLVVAPYTTIMSLSFKPKQALANLKKMIKKNFLGRYGFYDAIDYSKDFKNNKNNKKANIAKIYYAHHQGFSLQALNNQINQDRIYSLIQKDPKFLALDTLFEERMPSSIPEKPVEHIDELQTEYITPKNEDVLIKQFVPISTSYPRRAFISNGKYSIDISNTGAGFSKVADVYLNRFRNDPLLENWGQFIYLYDFNKRITWSPTLKPTNISSLKNKIEFFENKAIFNKVFNEIESSLLVSVSPDTNTEFRSLTLTNQSKEKKEIKIGSYGEVALANYAEDLNHPAFEKLFIKSEFWSKQKALVYTKHNKEERGAKIYLAHKVFIPNQEKLNITYTTDRSQFLSRGDGLHNPTIFNSPLKKIKGNLNYNFDPIYSLQTEIELKPNETINIYYINTFGNSKEEISKNLHKYSNQRHIIQAINKSDEFGKDILNTIGISQEQALNYQILASKLLSSGQSNIYQKQENITPEAKVQSLWRIGLSGELPILLVRFYDMSDLVLVKSMLQCHRYLKHKGISHDLVFLNEYPTSYIKSFEDEVDFLIRYNQPPTNKSVKGNIFHLKSSHINSYDKESLFNLAKIVLDSKVGNIEQQILSITQSEYHISNNNFKFPKKISSSGRDTSVNLEKLKFFNGFGGFDLKAHEYIININYSKGLETPSPWVNIIANKNIGFVLTENGSSYTWLFDSYDNRLTSRIDDPLIDKSSEIFYLRDEETGDFWCPTPLPIKSNHTYKISHGLGYSSIYHKSRGIEQEILYYVPKEDTVKIIKFKFKNTNKTSKKLSLFGFLELSLGGPNREYVKDHLYTFKDEELNSVIVKNTYHEAFKEVLAFVDFNKGESLITNSREEFLGKGNTMENPIIMQKERISDTISFDIDHCIGAQTIFELKPNEEKEIIVLLGGGKGIDNVKNLIKKYRQDYNTNIALDEIKDQWNLYLNKIQIKTPDESLNILFNERLIYQLVSSRLLARTGYYQPSGAYGFRDQLQDSIALIWSNPHLTKDIILKVARHQFLEGDVENWWHEHNSFGIRTVFSDQQIWLPYVVSMYLDITEDQSILDNKESYLKAPVLDFINNPHWAGIPEVDTNSYSIYDHCLRAIEKTLVFGQNGLPLIGKNDWNDGLSKVGEKGNGESVWLGWFLYFTLKQFIPYIQKRGQENVVTRYQDIMKNLQQALEKNAWDGKWYKRAFFDNGSPLGSRFNKEFKIDSISQSWAVLSGAGREDRVKTAMNSVHKHLFQDENLLLLIDPALQDSSIDPGYIKDYPPGVRENGAQYNHAALWSVQAFASLGEAEIANKILDSINPIKRSDTKEKASLYRVEPYVVASDIYAKPATAGRGGWTWYTGSAGVMYRTILEYILGLKVRGNKMEVNPKIPKDWSGFSLLYTYKNTPYQINVKRSIDSNTKILLDGTVLFDKNIYLLDDNREHKIEIYF